jgi:hypothetical protein
MSEHTPGPWIVDYDGNICAGPDKHLLAYVVPDPTWGIDAEANARLIAAAPDLLAACEIAMILLDRVDYDGTWILLDYAPSEKAATDRIASAVRAARGGLR